MPRLLHPIPRELQSDAFVVGVGFDADMSRRQLRHPRFDAPHRGVRRQAAAARSHTLYARTVRAAADYLPLLRVSKGEAYSHTTALLLYGAPIRTSEELHVSLPRPHGPARGSGVRGHRCSDAATAGVMLVETSAGVLLCVSPAFALVQSAPMLSFREQVVAADHLVKLRGPGRARWALAELEALVSAAEAANGRGIRRLRAALSVARVGAESRMETLQHFELARMGLDFLELQADLFDTDGRWIGRFDSVDRMMRRILEYDGEQHRLDRAQYLRDEQRLDRVRAEGYEVKRTHAEDFRPELLPQTRRELCAFLQLEQRPVAPSLARYFAEPH